MAKTGTKRRNDISEDNEKKKTKVSDEKQLSFLEGLNRDIFYEVCAFLDATTFTNLSVVNKKMNENFNIVLQHLIDYDEFEKDMTRKRVALQFMIWTISQPSKIMKKFKNAQKFSLEIFYKALDRFPGGNADQFIHKFIILLSGNRKPELKKGSIFNFDGQVTANKLGGWKQSRDLNPLLKSLSALSFETPNKPRKKTFYNTVTDSRSDHNEYDTEWSKIELSAKFNDELLFKFEQQVIYSNDRKFKKDSDVSIPITPTTAKMLQELSQYCGVIKPNDETNDSISSNESGGRAMKFPEESSTYRSLELLENRVFNN